MPLAGYPAETLYPAEDLYPGIPAYRAVFATPTQDMAFQLEGNLYAMLPHALSVWRINGTWSQGFAPSADIVAAADRFYRGGYQHEVTNAQIDELTAAGYGARITVLEVLG